MARARGNHPRYWEVTAKAAMSPPKKTAPPIIRKPWWETRVREPNQRDVARAETPLTLTSRPCPPAPTWSTSTAKMGIRMM